MTISEIFRSYDVKRNVAESLANARREKALSDYPELNDLEESRKLLMLDLLESSLLNDGRRTEIQAEIDLLDEKISQFQQDNGIASFEPEYDCSLCGDTGYINSSDGISKEFCPCILEKIYSEVFGAKKIGDLNGSFGKFDAELFSNETETLLGIETSQRKQILNARQYAENYVKAYPDLKRPNLLLIGNPGLGKSFLMECIARRLYIKTQKILYISSFDLFSCFHKNRLGELNDINLIDEADVILLDDLGTEPMTQNVTREYFQRLIDRRFASRKPIIIATNLQESQIRSRYGERLASRLFSEFDFRKIFFIGKDLRLN